MKLTFSFRNPVFIIGTIIGVLSLIQYQGVKKKKKHEQKPANIESEQCAYIKKISSQKFANWKIECDLNTLKITIHDTLSRDNVDVSTTRKSLYAKLSENIIRLSIFLKDTDEKINKIKIIQKHSLTTILAQLNWKDFQELAHIKSPKKLKSFFKFKIKVREKNNIKKVY